MSFIVHSMSQPRLLVKLATGVSTRKKLMTTFCNEFLRMTIRGASERRSCNISCDATLSGEERAALHQNPCAADQVVIDAALPALVAVIARYESEDLFSMNETGIIIAPYSS
ncbi:hypothetical protein Plhal304r1_c023g0079681 [Plasmopara halstedii]